jgi:D-alanyl-D-alanine carboxypeptidase
MSFALALVLTACTRPAPRAAEAGALVRSGNERLRAALEAAAIPDALAAAVLRAEDAFLPELLAILAERDGYQRLLVDKQHPLEPQQYVPPDLVELTNEGAFRIGRQGLLLRLPAAEALQEMAEEALKDGIVLVASSTYRSYEYQLEVYARNVRENGRDQADRESSRAGYSQHQTGLAVDFGSITDAYAGTPAGRWLSANAGRFGWSLSFPDGYEELTGYRWECWHYRYVGKPLARFIDAWFAGVQQYGLRFVYEWEGLSDGLEARP